MFEKSVDASHHGDTGRRHARVTAKNMPWIAASVTVLAYGGYARLAKADDPSVNTGLTQLAQNALSAPLALPSATIAPPSLPAAFNPYAEADALKIRGLAIPLPTAVDTIDQGLFGIREALADYGISYLGISTTTFQDNLLRHQLPAGNQFGPHSRDLQLYAGQLPTYTTTNELFLFYDLRRYGIPDGQIAANVVSLSTNWAPSGPDGLYLGTLSYYQTLFNKKVEVKFGWLQNAFEFLGTQVGGSLANGVFGPNASVPGENGLNSGGAPTLGVNIKYNFPDSLYTKVGVQRAISPNGTVVERLNNPTALNFKITNAGVAALDEVGYRVNPLPGRLQTWIRAAASITTSRYQEILTPTLREQPDYGLYFLIDHQLLQTAPRSGFGSPRRGVYAGFTFEDTPHYFNTFDRYYEGRLYGFGLIPDRPNDLISFVANHSTFSDESVIAAREQHLLAHPGVTSVTGSYGIQALPGVNINLGVSYTDHPTIVTFTRSTGSALNFLANAVLFL